MTPKVPAKTISKKTVPKQQSTQPVAVNEATNETGKAVANENQIPSENKEQVSEREQNAEQSEQRSDTSGEQNAEQSKQRSDTSGEQSNADSIVASGDDGDDDGGDANDGGEYVEVIKPNPIEIERMQTRLNTQHVDAEFIKNWKQQKKIINQYKLNSLWIINKSQ